MAYLQNCKQLLYFEQSPFSIGWFLVTKIAATYSGNKGHENGMMLNKASLRNVYGISHGVFPSIEMN